MKLTIKEMTAIIEEKRIAKYSASEKAQVMAFAFGDKFMSSSDKGKRKQY
jgi:hypothetical protein